MSKAEEILELLNTLEIPYTLKEHEAAFQMEDFPALCPDAPGELCKNLFLRDYKGKRHMLVVLKGDKEADLKLIREEISSSRLSFGSDERLKKRLNVESGSVSPLGLIYDAEQAVEVYFDADLKDAACLGFHPNDNTKTVFLSFHDLEKYIAHSGHKVLFIRV